MRSPTRLPSSLSIVSLRAVTRLLPRRFREVYADDILQLYGDRYAGLAATGALDRSRFLMRSLLDVLVAALAEHRRSTFHPTRPSLRGLTPRSGDGFLSSLIYDLKHALHGAAKRPGFTAIVVLTLALGIGANTAIFTVVNGVLLKPLPYDESDRLIRVWGRFDPESGFDFPQIVLSRPEYIDYRAQNRTMDDVAAYGFANATLVPDGAPPERVRGTRVTPNLFSVLRVSAQLGRTFTDDEGRPGGEPVVILSHDFWQARFGGDPATIGSSVDINGTSRTIIGIMPEGFGFPRPNVQLYAPFVMDPANPGGRSAHGTSSIARQGDGQTLAAAAAEMDTLMAAWKAAWPDIHTGHYLFLRPLLEDMVGNAADVTDVARCLGLRAADRVCQCGGHRAGARRGSVARDRSAHGAGSEPGPAHPARPG